MLLVRDYFKTFTKKEVSDATKTTEVINALSCETRKEVDVIINKAKEAGAKLYDEPKDYGWMYQHGFQDLDGHLWEVFFMDEKAMPKG